MLSVHSRAFLDNLKSKSSTKADISGIPRWLEVNTAHPTDPTKPWSFKDHEYQEKIAGDAAHLVSAQKSAQTGVSELFARWALALVNTWPSCTAIYTLPTASFTTSFSASRLTPIIEGSPYMQAQAHKDTDSTKLKRFGNSYLYILGAYNKLSAISVPALAVVFDEVDHSNQEVLSSFHSRLQHQDDGGYVRQFSTPTVDGYGISAAMQGSTSYKYLVKCRHCHTRVYPDFLEDVVVPGYKGKLVEFSKEDLFTAKVKADEAWVSCPKCHKEITPANLADPEAREWVAEFPDAEDHGYYISPMDCPRYNPTAKVLKSITRFRRVTDWVNFSLGQTHEDTDNSFSASAITSAPKCQVIVPSEDAGVAGVVIGCDVGKISHITVGYPGSNGLLEVFWMEQFTSTPEYPLSKRLIELHQRMLAVKGCVDAGPFFTESEAYVRGVEPGQAYAIYYKREQSKASLTHIDIKPEGVVANVVRTESITLLSRAVNSGKMAFPHAHEEMGVMTKHLRAMKRITKENDQGEEVVTWINTGPDHYAHALNYLYTAYLMLDGRFSDSKVIPTLPMVSKVKIKQVSVPGLMGNTRKRAVYGY